MTAEGLLSIFNLITMAAWLPLVFLPRVRWTATFVPVVVPLLLAIIYVILIVATLGQSEVGFSSLAGVRALFDNPWTLLAGWTHYLAFDLFIGGWDSDVFLWAGGLATLSDDPIVGGLYLVETRVTLARLTENGNDA